MIKKSPDHAFRTERHTGTKYYDVKDNTPELVTQLVFCMTISCGDDCIASAAHRVNKCTNCNSLNIIPLIDKCIPVLFHYWVEPDENGCGDRAHPINALWD